MDAHPAPDADLDAAIAEAVAAFDAANHAFGRFVTYVVRPRGEAVPTSVRVVREALQEAAISVPQEPSLQAAAAFLDALRLAGARLSAFLADPPGGYALEEAMQAPGALEEAIAVLEAALTSAAPPASRQASSCSAGR
jgi:hypothetical protein